MFKRKVASVTNSKRPPLTQIPWAKIMWRHTKVQRPQTAVDERRIRSLHSYRTGFIAGALALTIALFGIIAVSRLTARDVECFTQYGICPDKYADIVRQLVGQKLLSPNWRPVVDQLKAFPETVKVETSRRLPSTLVVSVSLRSALGSVSSDITGSPGAIVDENGQIMKTSSDPTLPLLISTSFSASTQNISPSEVSALKILRQLNVQLASRTVGTLEGLALTVVSQGNPKILIDVSRPVSSWQTSLQSILARSKISSKQPEKIDLRFNDPILVYNQ